MTFDSNALKVLENVSGLNETSAEFGINAFDRLQLDVDFKAGVTAGVFILETAPFSGYTGAWHPLITVTFAGAAPRVMSGTAENGGRVGRVRVSSAVADGVADAYVTRSIVGRGNS